MATSLILLIVTLVAQLFLVVWTAANVRRQERLLGELTRAVADWDTRQRLDVLSIHKDIREGRR